MGFLRAFAGAVGGELANQWKEFYTCDSLPSQVLIRRASHMVSGRSSNRRADVDDISKGSAIIVNEGLCAILVSQGKIVDLAAEPGAYTWDDNTSPSMFSGPISDVISRGWERFTFGGLNPVQQRIYYVNMKELTGCRFGTPQPVPFRIVDPNIGLDLDTAIRCNGTYTMRVADPVVLYSTIAGNISDEFTIDQINDQLRAEFIQALQPAFAQLSGMGIRPSALPGQTRAISDAMKAELDQSWESHYGLTITSVQIISATIPEEDQKMLSDIQRQAVYKNRGMAGAALVQAQAEAMRTAAGNSQGAMMGFAGLNMANAAGGINANQFFDKDASSDSAAEDGQDQTAGGEDMWFCPKCGTRSNGNFCPKCGTKKPVF
ncbi:MAG: SPFH domain-containing protein [Lachnospiraceae bacterium]|nr:SPFH domain-containing protein [Lachnospiraceae bacterium]